MKPFKLDIFSNTAARLYIFTIFLNISLVWLLPYFPTQDGPNHVYNLVILDDLLKGGEIWGNYYSINLGAVPNLGFLAISYPFIQFIDPFTVERIFITIYILLMSISVPVYIRTFAPSNLPLSFVVFPLLFNFCLMMGFYSYVITVPCLLLALSSAWATRNRKPLFRLITLNLIGITLFYLHLIPFVIFLISLVAISATSSRKIFRVLRETAFLTLIISPLLIILFNYIYNLKSLSYAPAANGFSFPYLLKLILELLTFSSYSSSPWQILPSALLLLALYPAIKTRFIKCAKSSTLNTEQLFTITFSSSLGLLYLFLPFGFGGGSYFNQRLTIIIVIVLLSFLKIPDDGFYRKYCHVMLCGIALISLLTNAVIFRSQASNVQEFLSGLKTNIPRGSIIALYKPMDSESKPVDPLQHASSYYALEKQGVDAGNYAARMLYFQVQFKDTLPPLPDWNLLENAPEKIEWKQYPGVRYLLGWKVERNNTQRLKKDFKRLVTTKNFCLMERR